MLQSGPKNLITDVAGLQVGNAEDAEVKSGVTVLTADSGFVAAVHVMGGAPGSRETELLAPDKLLSEVDALVLSGGSALGLSAASGVADAMRTSGRGFMLGDQNVPIVASAILFDLWNGGQKNWTENPYAALGAAALAAAGAEFDLGSVGAGTGATTETLKGGLGSASLRVDGFTVGAIVAVNALGSAIVGDGPHFWAAPFEIGAEFGGLGPAPHFPAPSLPDAPAAPGTATTIAIVATDAALDKSQAHRMAVTAQTGLARAVVPSHTLLDGDTVFAAATGTVPLDDPVRDQLRLNHAGAICLARAVARGLHAATPAPNDPKPCWTERFAPGKGATQLRQTDH